MSQEETQKLKENLHNLTKEYNDLMDDYTNANGEDPEVHWALLKLFPFLLKAKRDYLQAVLNQKPA